VAEQVTCPSREMVAYQKRISGTAKWAIKRGLLIAKPVATRLFTYHGSVLAQPAALPYEGELQPLVSRTSRYPVSTEGAGIATKNLIAPHRR
jgi:hypothetical protein